MILVTTENIPGRTYEALGLVKGSSVQCKHVGSDITQSLKTLVGGELKSYSDMMVKARTQATERMVAEAEALGADAVVAVRFSSAAIVAGAAEILTFGTAVKFTN